MRKDTIQEMSLPLGKERPTAFFKFIQGLSENYIISSSHTLTFNHTLPVKMTIYPKVTSFHIKKYLQLSVCKNWDETGGPRLGRGNSKIISEKLKTFFD